MNPSMHRGVPPNLAGAVPLGHQPEPVAKIVMNLNDVQVVAFLAIQALPLMASNTPEERKQAPAGALQLAIEMYAQAAVSRPYLEARVRELAAARDAPQPPDDPRDRR
jgi:hypothetical protein